jgi:hypothetical protein
MRVAIVGGTGHFQYALDGISARPSLALVAIAPGRDGEDLSALEAA